METKKLFGIFLAFLLLASLMPLGVEAKRCDLEDEDDSCSVLAYGTKSLPFWINGEKKFLEYNDGDIKLYREERQRYMKITNKEHGWKRPYTRTVRIYEDLDQIELLNVREATQKGTSNKAYISIGMGLETPDLNSGALTLTVKNGETKAFKLDGITYYWKYNQKRGEGAWVDVSNSKKVLISQTLGTKGTMTFSQINSFLRYEITKLETLEMEVKLKKVIPAGVLEYL